MRARVRMRRLRGGTACSSDEISDKEMERRRCGKEPNSNEPTSNGRSPMNEAKPFCISKKEVWEAYQRVKENKGAAGVDEESIEDFEKNLKKNLYKIWNRMSSGNYFPINGGPPTLHGGKAPALIVSRPAQRSLTVENPGLCYWGYWDAGYGLEEFHPIAEFSEFFIILLVRFCLDRWLTVGPRSS